ncbi:MAG: hypothetical protein IH820_09240, partial [Bacteroidetes bacterium]|nr:hypothetical protein [Bacteroidota bacterium]
MKTALVFSVVVTVGMIVVGPAHAQTDPSGLWTDVEVSAIGTPSQFDPVPVQFRGLRLNQQALLDLLAQAPRER